jgi:thiol:disulfide interchange protein DsbC
MLHSVPQATRVPAAEAASNSTRSSPAMRLAGAAVLMAVVGVTLAGTLAGAAGAAGPAAPAGAAAAVTPTAAPAAAPSSARPASAPAAAKGDVRAELARKLPGSKPEDFKTSPVPGVFELARGADIIYVTADGKYAFAGDLYDMGSDINLSDKRRRDLRVELLNAVPDSQAVVFSPKTPRYTVTVFTDVDCSYCRKMHSEIARYNELGIRVRYLFFPRSGPDSESWAAAEAVWCSPNRNDALTRAKRGETIKSPKCANTPVARDYELGQNIGLRGTPAIVLANGDMLPGYLPPAMLAKRLESGGR